MELNNSMITEIGWVVQVLTALCCIVYLLLVLHSCETSGDRSVLKTVIAYITVLFLPFFFGVVYRLNPAFYVCIAPLVLFVLVISPVLLYKIVYGLTNTKGGKRFSRLHFVVPVLITVIWTVITTLSLPFDVRVDIIRNFAQSAPGYGWQSAYFTSLSLHFFGFGLIYLPLSCAGLLAYRKVTSMEGHPNSRYRMRWMSAVLVLSILFTLSGCLVSVTGNRHIYFNQLKTGTQGVANITILFILTLNILRKNYPPRQTRRNVLVPVSVPEDAHDSTALEKKPEKIEVRRKPLTTEKRPVKLTKGNLESYFRSEKPWLDPGLTLVGLAEKLGTNRVILSGFINRTYGINFNTWVNEWRLAELERLRKYKKYNKLLLVDLIALAGFGSYDSYRRAKEAYKGKEEGDEQ